MRVERLTPTRVYRFYRGGALIGRLRGESEKDSSFPEDWVGSVTPASNPGRDEPDAGLSRIDGGRLLKDAIEEDPLAWLGKAHVSAFGRTTGLLVKLLDSAERLPVHAHPNRAFARRHFKSPFGKTEAWIVIATRAERGQVWVGLREPVSPGEYLHWIETQDVAALLAALNRIEVEEGDVIFVPAGVPHAIGAGLLIAELQEPTDLSFVCEWDGFPIDPVDSHLGLGWDTAIEALDLNTHTPMRELPASARNFFWADETAEARGRFTILIAIAGEGTVNGDQARAGDCFAVPAAVRQLDVAPSLRILRCVAPDPLPT